MIVVDECHRSIYGVWRQVLEYFDAHVIGLTATPGKQTFGFFDQNLVMEYGHEQAVADRVNVDFDVYRIRTDISARGGTIEAGLVTKFRDRETRAVRLEKIDEDIVYTRRPSTGRSSRGIRSGRSSAPSATGSRRSSRTASGCRRR